MVSIETEWVNVNPNRKLGASRKQSFIYRPTKPRYQNDLVGDPMIAPLSQKISKWSKNCYSQNASFSDRTLVFLNWGKVTAEERNLTRLSQRSSPAHTIWHIIYLRRKIQRGYEGLPANPPESWPPWANTKTIARWLLITYFYKIFFCFNRQRLCSY